MPKKTKSKKSCVTDCPYDIISIGDCGMDMFLGVNTVGNRLCKKDTDQCFLQLSYADKIQADFQEYATGGNAANLAIGSSRLGLHASFYTVLGNDMIGDIVEKAIVKEDVEPDYIKRMKGGKTNFHVVLNHEAERTILIYHNERKYAFPRFKKAAWVYYTSMGKGYEKMHPDLIKYIKRTKAKLGFNPGTIQLEGGYKTFKDILKVTEVLIVNTQEAHRILGAKHDGFDFKPLMKKLSKLGPKQIIVTDGPQGAYGFDGKKYWYAPIYDVPVLERTGAGDSFSTGLISALVSKNTLPEAMIWGTFNSASVIQYVGPQEGLLTKKKMQKFVKDNPDFKAEEI